MDLLHMRILIDRLPRARFAVDRAMAKATKVTATLSDMPHGTDISSPVERGVELLEIARATCERIERELAAMRGELGPKLDALNDPLEKTVMRMRYMEGRRVSEIAYSLCYSERHIFRVLKRVERRVQERCH